MKQLTLTTATGTVAYDLASLVPLPAIKAGCLTFLTRAGVEVSVPAADVLEFSVGTAPKLTKADRVRTELVELDTAVKRSVVIVHESANETADANDGVFLEKLDDFFSAVVREADARQKAEKFFARRAETERKRAAGETKPRTRKATPIAPVEATPTPKAKRAKK